MADEDEKKEQNPSQETAVTSTEEAKADSEPSPSDAAEPTAEKQAAAAETQSQGEEAAKAEKEEPSGPSKMPDLKELGSMATTLYKAVKKGVSEIVADYKAKRADDSASKDDK